MSNPAKFWDWMARRYARTPVADPESYEKKLQITRKYLHPDMQVLEFGCGTGSTALLHAPHVQHIVATDYSANMIQIARDKAAAENVSNISFEQATLDELSAPGEGFDLVLGMSILHLLPDKEAALTQVYQLLAPGGVFVSSTACLGGAMHLLRPVLALGRLLGLLPLVRFFSAEKFKTSIENAGFEIEYEWQPNAGSVLFLVARKPA